MPKEKEKEIKQDYLERELFIGLGGTGGETLRLLFKQMTENQKKNANYIYFDTEQAKVDEMQSLGIPGFAISNADTVQRVRDSLGKDDGVPDWLPDNREFLNSHCDDGASQCRYKSRLCLARFLKNGASQLKTLLEDMTRPGLGLEKIRLRIVIASSIAGGTGAGTVVQVALFIRKFFRDLGQSPMITGILSLPDLYVDLTNDEVEKSSMYANAYAVIRELNAMNLVSSVSDDEKDGSRAAQMLRGYGTKVNVRIATKSEGTLFDSADPLFAGNPASRPFDLIYFVDKANEKGGILRDIHEYYRVMADIAYTRLYSPMNAAIIAGENNEMNSHLIAPTAIYGGAGFARIVYPYEDIMTYLAEKKLSDDLNALWLYPDSLWDNEVKMEQDAARSYGARWSPRPGQRGKKFRDDINAELREEKTRYAFLGNMIYGQGKSSRLHTYLNAVKKSARSLELPAQSEEDKKNNKDKNKNNKKKLPVDPAALGSSGGAYSVLRDSDFLKKLKELIKFTTPETKSESEDESLYDMLLNTAAQVENLWGDFAASLERAVKGQARRLSAAILPLDGTTAANASPVNLHDALLSRKGIGDVHPLAARYLLYGLQEQCMTNGTVTMNELRQQLTACLKKANLALDPNKQDNDDITIAMAVEETQSHWMTARTEERYAREDYALFCEELEAAIVQALLNADLAVYKRALGDVAPAVDELISLYEGFFRAITPYQSELQQRIYADLNKHDSSGNQTIYVGASSYVKQHYAVDRSVEIALASDPDAVYAAAGAGVYENLERRLRRRMEQKDLAERLGEEAPEEEAFRNMDTVFTGIIKKYEQLLAKCQTTLDTDVMGALINEICAELEISESEIKDSQMQFEQLLRDKIGNLRAKARPMIRFNEENSMKYFAKEEEVKTLDVSKIYCNFGFSPAAAEHICRYFKSDNQDRLSFFRERMLLGKENKFLESPAYNDREILCFSAVHCLQPTQIYHFLEDQADESYYPEYKARVRSGEPTQSPHLDKRWLQCGSMPFISANLELKWRKTVMKALIFEALRGLVSFTVDGNNTRCFVRLEDDELKYLYWPKKEQILTRNVSRLVEYLAEDEERIEEEAMLLDSRIERQKQSLYSYVNTPALYKQGMTKDQLLSLLRADMIVFQRTERAARAAKILKSEDGEMEIDLSKTMGGVLHIAYLMHCSEERLGEDKDYGEELLTAAAEIIDSYALGMYGETHSSDGTLQHKAYVEIYNWAIDKFMAEWIRYASAVGSETPAPAAAPAPAADAAADTANTIRFTSNRLSMENDRPSKARQLDDVPEKLRGSAEYIWLKANWSSKKLDVNE